MAKQYIKSLVTLMVTSKKKTLVIALAAIAGVLCSVVVASASAQAMLMATIGVKADNPTPTCSPAPYVFNPKTGKCELPQVTATVQGVQVSASDIQTGKVTILADVMMKAGTQLNSPRCHWVANGYNSGHGVNGNRSFYDPVPAKICPNRNSSTGWVKVAGGITGRACFNPYSPNRPMYPVVTGRVIMVRKLVNVKIALHAEAHVFAVNSNCPGSYAEGKGTADVTLTLNQLMRSQGDTVLKLSEAATARATANAQALVVCAPQSTVTNTVVNTVTSPAVTQPATTVHTTTTTTTTTPPPAQPPSLSNLTQPQEVFSNGETYPNIRVTASAMNGHSVTVSCGAQFGSMTGSQTFTSGGVDTLSFTYTAPNTPDAAGRTETISCSVHDNTSGLNGSGASVSFPIQAPPARP